MIVRFANNVLWDAFNAFHKLNHVSSPYSFYDYLGEFPSYHNEGGYYVDSLVYNRMMLLHSPHASTVIKAWVAKYRK